MGPLGQNRVHVQADCAPHLAASSAAVRAASGPTLCWMVLCMVIGALALPASTPASVKPDTSVYAGLGTWIDIFASGAWASPEASVDGMAAQGVRTLFLETGNYSQRADLPPRQSL